MGPDADTGGRELFAGPARACGTEAAEVVHIRGNKAAVTEKTGFQAHLGKGNIVINPFLGRFFGIVTGQIFDKTGIRAGINAEEKQGQPVKGDAACAQEPLRGRGKFGTFRERPFLTGTDLRRKSGDCLREGTCRIGKGAFRSFGGRFQGKSGRAFGNRGGGFGDHGVFTGTGFRNYSGGPGAWGNPCLRDGGTGIKERHQDDHTPEREKNTAHTHLSVKYYSITTKNVTMPVVA
jgi:hypothetical protein